MPLTSSAQRQLQGPSRHQAHWCSSSSKPGSARHCGGKCSHSPVTAFAADLSSVGRRTMLLGTSAAAGVLLGAVALPQPACAKITMTIKGKTQLKPFTLKAGYSVTVPDSWALAYDRSDGTELGTQVFFGDFRTFQTLSIFKLQQPEGQEGAEFRPEQLLETVIAEQRNNQSTYGFNLLSGPTARIPEAADGNPGNITYWDSEYELAVCRGLIQEGSGGRRRCVGPKDMDLQIVARRFYQAFAVQGKYIYIVRGSATTDAWEDVGPAAVQAVQSFRLAQA